MKVIEIMWEDPLFRSFRHRSSSWWKSMIVSTLPLVFSTITSLLPTPFPSTLLLFWCCNEHYTLIIISSYEKKYSPCAKGGENERTRMEWGRKNAFIASYFKERSSVSLRPGIFGPSSPFLLPHSLLLVMSLFSSSFSPFFLSPSQGIPHRFFHSLSLSFKGCRIHFTSLSICHPPILLGWKGNRKSGRDVYHPQSALFVYISWYEIMSSVCQG